MNINVSVSLFVLFMCLGIIVHPAFFILCMAIIIFLCLNNKQMQKEDFGYYTLNTVRKNPPPSSCKFNAKAGPWCGDYEELETDNNSFHSRNQALVGNKVNPRTLVAPLIAPPLADFEYWKKDNFSAYPSIVNRPRQQDLYLSGYVGGPCARGINSSCGQAVQRNIVKENFELSPEVRNMYAREFSTEGNIDQQYVNKKYVENTLEGGYKDPFGETCFRREPTLKFNNPDFKSMEGCVPQVGQIRENFEESQSYMVGENNYSENTPLDYSPHYPYYDNVRKVKDSHVGNEFVDKSCGYNKLNPVIGLPVNKCVTDSDSLYPQYNDMRSTQIVQPGMYFKSEVLDPINSNIGISYSQQFNPQTAKDIGKGQVLYTDHDANTHVGETYVNNSISGDELYNVYDPRYTGYADQNRYYLDKMTGQPRFTYDDIDAVKRPSYIVRSNVDHMGQFDQMGPMKHGCINYDYRNVAQKEFHESTLDSRSDIQIRLAQKNYARTYQLREMPLSATGRMRGR